MAVSAASDLNSVESSYSVVGYPYLSVIARRVSTLCPVPVKCCTYMYNVTHQWHPNMHTLSNTGPRTMHLGVDTCTEECVCVCVCVLD